VADSHAFEVSQAALVRSISPLISAASPDFMLQRDLRGMFNPYANLVDNVFAELRLHQKCLSDEYAKLVIDSSLSR
jgi:hypothetical protein